MLLKLGGQGFRSEHADVLVDIHGLLHKLRILLSDPLLLELGLLLQVVFHKSQLLLMTHFLFMFQILQLHVPDVVLLVHGLLQLAMLSVFLVKNIDVLLSLKLHLPPIDLLIRLSLAFGLQPGSKHVEVLLCISFNLQKRVSLLLLEIPQQVSLLSFILDFLVFNLFFHIFHVNGDKLLDSRTRNFELVLLSERQHRRSCRLAHILDDFILLSKGRLDLRRCKGSRLGLLLLLDLQLLIKLIKLLLFLKLLLLLLLLLKVLFFLSLFLGLLGIEVELSVVVIAGMLLLQLFAFKVVVVNGTARRLARFPLARQRRLEALFGDVEMLLVAIDVHTKETSVLSDFLLGRIVVIIKLFFHELVSFKPRDTT